jgi:hypothetical protein
MWIGFICLRTKSSGELYEDGNELSITGWEYVHQLSDNIFKIILFHKIS